MSFRITNFILIVSTLIVRRSFSAQENTTPTIARSCRCSTTNLSLLWQLTANSTGHRKARVHIGEEARRVILNLADLEPSASVLAVQNDTCGEGS
jgi:hypothetical protein